MRVVVTGSTGFLGGHLVEALAARGDEVISVERPGAARAWIADLPLTVIACGLDEAALARAMDGADVVFHAAGRSGARSAEEYDRVNVNGTAAVMRAAATHGPRAPHVVLFSSISAMGPCRDGETLRARDEPHPISPYGESKLRAEAVVREWADRVPATILRLTSVYGPRERGLFLFFRMVRRGFAVAIGDWEREVQLLHVHDMLRVLLRVADRPQQAAGTWFLAHPQRITWRAFADAVGKALDRPPRRITVPEPVAGAIARAAELAAWLQGDVSGLNRYRMRELAQRWVTDAERTWAHLGLAPEMPLEAGIPATVAWYRRAGWL